MNRKISYIVRQDVPGDELPIRLQVFGEDDNLNPIYLSAGIDLAAALRQIERFSGLDLKYLESLIYN